MNLKVPTKDLRAALGLMSHLPGAAPAVAYTQAVTFTAGLEGLELVRFSNQSKIWTLIESIELIEDGESFKVDHAILSSLVSGLSSDVTILTLEKKHLYVVNGNASAKIALYGEEANMDLPECELEVETISVECGDLLRWLNFLAPCMHKDLTTRPELCGIQFRMMNGKLTMIAADGKRCHAVQQAYQLPVDKVIGQQEIGFIRHALDGQKGLCQIVFGENTATFGTENIEITVALLETIFPNLEQFLFKNSTSTETKCSFSPQEMITALRTCAPMGYTDAKFAKASFTKTEVKLTADNRRESQIIITLPAKSTKPMEIYLATLQLAQTIELMTGQEDKSIEIQATQTAIYIYHGDKIAVIALSKE